MAMEAAFGQKRTFGKRSYKACAQLPLWSASGKVVNCSALLGNKPGLSQESMIVILQLMTYRKNGNRMVIFDLKQSHIPGIAE